MNVMYCRKCSTTIQGTAQFCSTCGNALSPQNDHPTFLVIPSGDKVSPPDTNEPPKSEMSGYKMSLMPDENVIAAPETPNYETGILFDKDINAVPGSVGYKTIVMLDENARSSTSRIKDYETILMPGENILVASETADARLDTVFDEHVTIASEIADDRLNTVFDENATVATEIPDIEEPKEESKKSRSHEEDFVNGNRVDSIIASEDKEGSLLNVYNHQAAGTEDETLQLVDAVPKSKDASDAGLSRPVELSDVTTIPTVLLQENQKGEEDNTLTAPGLLAQFKLATNVFRGEHRQAELSRGEHRQAELSRGEHRQPAGYQWAFFMHAQPHLPAAIVSRWQKKILFSRPYFLIGTGIILFVCFIILITSYTYLLRAKTALPPALAANVSNAFPGGSITISGTNFVPGGIVTLKADGVLLAQNSMQLPSASYSMASLALSSYNVSLDGSQKLTVQANGTFEATMTVPTAWSAGTHEVEANEQIGEKLISAKTSVTVQARTTSKTPSVAVSTPASTPASTPPSTLTQVPTSTTKLTPGPIAKPNQTPTPIPALTPTPTVQLPCLDVNNNTLSFSAIGGGNSPAAQTVTLSNKCGVGAWSAKSDAAWLTTNSPANATIAANGTANVSITASITNLAVKSYTGHIVFSAGASQVTVTVSLTVTQATTACIKVDSGTLNFDINTAQNPAAQSILITNCGSAGTVAVTVSPSYISQGFSKGGSQLGAPTPTPSPPIIGTNWLTASSGGALAQAGTLSVSVQVDRAASNLTSGIYTSTVVITVETMDGKIDTHIVYIIFTVRYSPPPASRAPTSTVTPVPAATPTAIATPTASTK